MIEGGQGDGYPGSACMLLGEMLCGLLISGHNHLLWHQLQSLLMAPATACTQQLVDDCTLGHSSLRACLFVYTERCPGENITDRRAQCSQARLQITSLERTLASLAPPKGLEYFC